MKTIAITMPFDIMDSHDQQLCTYIDDDKPVDEQPCEPVFDVKKIHISREIVEVADKLGKHDVCLDTGAGAGVFMSTADLEGLRSTDELTGICGINGGEDSLICDQMGDSVFGEEIGSVFAHAVGGRAEAPAHVITG